MERDTTIFTGTPIHPSTDRFIKYDLLLSHFQCWEEARGSHMIPLKRDYEGAMLEHPEILPNLSFMEIISPVELRYLYQGNLRVTQQCRDWTNSNFLEAFAPGAKQFVMDWTSANIARPFLALWTDRTLLQKGTTMEFTALTCVLADDKGRPTCTATVSVFDETLADEASEGSFLNGSGGMEIIPIDIGLGVPDLPNTLLREHAISSS